jgi:hypothetical protein
MKDPNEKGNFIASLANYKDGLGGKLWNTIRTSSTDAIAGLDGAIACSSSGTKQLNLEPTSKRRAEAQDHPFLEGKNSKQELTRCGASPSTKDSGGAPLHRLESSREQASPLPTVAQHQHLA